MIAPQEIKRLSMSLNLMPKLAVTLTYRRGSFMRPQLGLSNAAGKKMLVQICSWCKTAGEISEPAMQKCSCCKITGAVSEAEDDLDKVKTGRDDNVQVEQTIGVAAGRENAKTGSYENKEKNAAAGNAAGAILASNFRAADGLDKAKFGSDTKEQMEQAHGWD